MIKSKTTLLRALMITSAIYTLYYLCPSSIFHQAKPPIIIYNRTSYVVESIVILATRLLLLLLLFSDMMRPPGWSINVHICKII